MTAHLTKLTKCIAKAFTKQLNDNFPAIKAFKEELVSSASAVFGNGQPMLWQVTDKTLKKLVVYAADKIELEWPTTDAIADLSGCLDSRYFFS